MNERVKELVVDDVRNDSDEDEDEVGSHVDENVIGKNRKDEELMLMR